MPFSHHSHSGQFCPGHAKDSLEEIVQVAIAKKMHTFALTEHMPRHDVDRYPEELSAHVTLTSMIDNETAYFMEANRLRQKYHGRISILIGFESDWIRPQSVDLINQSIRSHAYDFFVGSVHHVHTIPIDYDRALYEDARRVAGGTDERLFEDYFDAQLEMFRTVKPPVVGHFDLIRLKSDEPNGSLAKYAGVWQRILRNLDFVASYGGILELNLASVRKGLQEPYPQADICQAAVERKLQFCLSDDSHGIEQVAHSYERVLAYLQDNGVKSLTYLESDKLARCSMDDRFSNLQAVDVDVAAIEQYAFWAPQSRAFEG